MTEIEIRQVDGLAELNSAVAEEVLVHCAEIRRNHVKQLLSRIHNGHHLLEIKRLIGHGNWLDWLIRSGQTPYTSERTPQRDMLLAGSLYHMLPDIEHLLDGHTSAAALLEIISKDNDGDALGLALQIMARGQRVTTADAEQLTYVLQASPALAERVADGSMALKDAASVVDALHSSGASPAVAALVQETGVRSAEVVRALVVLEESAPDTFAEVAAAKAIYNPLTELQVPLDQANASDAYIAHQYDEAEREGRRLDNIRSHSKRERIAKLEGTKDEVIRGIEALYESHRDPLLIFVYAPKTT